MKSTANSQGLKFISIILVLLLALSVFSACEQSIADMDYPDEKLLARILDDYRDSLIEDGLIDKDSDAKCEIVRCYGIYNESVALILQCDALGYPDTSGGGGSEISGITFFDDWRRIQIWNDGELYSLTEACADEILRKEDIAKLAKDHNCFGKEYLAEKYSEFVAKNNGGEEQEYTLAFYYGKYLLMTYTEETSSHEICGEYEAALFNDGASGEPHTETVAGVEFKYKSGSSIQMVSSDKSECLSLQEAYDRGIIDKEDIEKIAQIHHNESNYPQS
ncbi:MAG: hypothetical protein IKJ24_07410 [Clostridia bacterium]|nr:hypothetical protein [Clostridia bacterium]